MKKHLFTLSALAFFVVACNNSPQSETVKPATNDSLQTALVYECPMKCDSKTYDKPGKCTVCGMDLIVKK